MWNLTCQHVHKPPHQFGMSIWHQTDTETSTTATAAFQFRHVVGQFLCKMGLVLFWSNIDKVMF